MNKTVSAAFCPRRHITYKPLRGFTQDRLLDKYNELRKSSGLHDLSRDLLTAPDDIVALRRAREVGRPDFEAYLRFLAGFPSPPRDELRRRKGPAGDRSFEL